MESPVNVGIIGYGYAGRNFHSYLIGFEKWLNLYAVCVRDPERRKRVKTFSDVDDMLKDDDIDLVVVATPYNTHAALSVKAVDAGKHVVVEKIMCMNTEKPEARQTISLQGKNLLAVKPEDARRGVAISETALQSAEEHRSIACNI